MLDINEIVVGETKVRILSLPRGVRQNIGDIGTIVEIDERDLESFPIAVNFGENQICSYLGDDFWWFNPKHLEIVENEESIVEYKVGSKFRVVNLDGDLNLEKCGVEVGDIGVIIEESDEEDVFLLFNENWQGGNGYASKKVYFNNSNIEPFLEKPFTEKPFEEESVVKQNTLIADSHKYEKGVTKFKVLNNVDNNIYLFKDVKVGDVVTYEGILDNVIVSSHPSWTECYLYFQPHQIELIKDEDIEEITESRWKEIIENIEGGYGLTDEESEIVKSVLKLNKPFNVVPDKVDKVLSKEVQTHLDSTHIGDTGNCSLYYKSEILKKWFWWNDEYFWEECKFSYKEGEGLIPIKIGETE